eukprot:TRINITY_DN4935_c0_g1_i2.p1 TRINITY_DN4935_c0_g1~~TRINITY_DN4935_c0_g1_i2.p1  ORF type:complete len:214 (+),score=21.21 TRINITY_DN4935_c0_g1_i2:84-725(+)
MNFYNARLRVRNTFYELYTDEPKLRRCTSEPVVSFISDAKDTIGVLWRPDPVVSQNRAALILNPATSSSSHADTGLSLALAEQRSMTALLKFDPCDTTIMVRDLPCKVGYERMMRELKAIGLDGCYDFIYCPRSTRDRAAFKGFCFVNFMTREAMETFVRDFAQHQFEDIHSEKTVRFDRAEVQGRKANLAHLLSGRNRVVFKSDPAGLRANS